MIQDAILKYYKQLSVSYPTKRDAAAEVINLSALVNLPKGTEHFISDVHGEFDSFQHVLKNASGAIARKVDDEFGSTLTKKEKRALCTLIYYPEEKLDLIQDSVEDFPAWCKTTLLRLIRVARRVASKYTRAKFEQALDPQDEYIVEELLTERAEIVDKEAYYDQILEAIIDTGSAQRFITVFCRFIQHLAVERLHVIGDVFDRGPAADMVMETLCKYHSVDIQWGNHDIAWMGAACGSYACIASVIRIAIRYGNLNMLELGYGINLVPLITFAMKVYGNDDCSLFEVGWGKGDERTMYSRVHKAITMILFKLEGQLAKRHPEFGMDSRRVLEQIDTKNGTVVLDGKVYKLADNFFPTLQSDVYALTAEEKAVMYSLKRSFASSEKLQRHIEFLYNRGSMYRVYNGNLLYHGCVPFDKNGEFLHVTLHGEDLCGKALFDALEKWARAARYSRNNDEKDYGKDVMYYMWSCPSSPLFGKEKMATFERYFIDDKQIQKEDKNSYYTLIDNPKAVSKIFAEFGLDQSHAHIINGHVPVKLKDGQSPVHCNGKVIVIDGGFSKAYQPVTGIAGYTLVFNATGLKLVAHKPFVSVSEAISSEMDIHSESEVVDTTQKRLLLADTDLGKQMLERIDDLKQLIQLYKLGTIREHQN